MLYAAHATQRLMMKPINMFAETGQMALAPFADSHAGARFMQAGLEMMGRVTRPYDKPTFDLDVAPAVIDRRPFCQLLRFAHRPGVEKPHSFFLVAPLSGHHATLLRRTVDALLDHGDVVVTDWTCGSRVPKSEGTFALDDFVGYLIDFMRVLKAREPHRGFHAIGVCQPGPGLTMASAIQAARGEVARPNSMSLISAPMDPAAAPTQVTKLADSYPPGWFRANVIHAVPHGMAGVGRQVYPGFLQLMGFMSMDPDRHMEKHRNLFFDRIAGNDDAADRTAAFYDEYLSVLDLDASLYLDSIERVFQKRELINGTATWQGQPLAPGQLDDMGLQTIEGAGDDICAPGQTVAAHEILSGLPTHRRDHHVEPEVGHYGGFAGSRFKANILPRILDFATANGA